MTIANRELEFNDLTLLSKVIFLLFTLCVIICIIPFVIVCIFIIVVLATIEYCFNPKFRQSLEEDRLEEHDNL